MMELLLVLGAIALLDSLTMVPLAVLPITMALGSARPWTLALSFVTGIFATYFLCGIPVLLGAEALHDHLSSYLSRLWNQPNSIELCVQILIGLLLMISSGYLWRNQRSKAQKKPSASPGAMAFLGASLVVLGMPGAVPYLAAIERIVNHAPNWAAALGYLGIYNFVFIVPLLGLIGLRAILGNRADPWFQAVEKFCIHVMPRLTAVLFFLIGLVMVADGIGWFCGYPLLPVTSQPMDLGVNHLIDHR